MARVGIRVDRALGVSIPDCRRIARGHRGDHALALALWDTQIHEARIVAGMVDEPGRVTRAQMDGWSADFDSWDLCDQVCLNLFVRTPHARRAATAWMRSEREFVKRAGFALVAVLAVHDDDPSEAAWLGWLPAIRRGSLDERNYVKKAVSWALRQIGKRTPSLNAAAISEAEHLCMLESTSARWIGRDALRELRSDQVRARLDPSTTGAIAR